MSRTRDIFVFEAVGTRGDIAPLIAVGAELVRRGHTCYLLGPSAFAREATEQGLHFHTTTTRNTAFVGAHSEITFSDFYFPAFESVTRFFAHHHDDLFRPHRRVIVCNIERTATSNLMCERYGIAGARMHLTPYKLRSLVSPPMPFRMRFPAHADGRPNAELAAYFSACDHHAGLVHYINERRRELNLHDIDTAWAPEPHIGLELGLFPRWFASPPPDWPQRLKLVGFPLPAPYAGLSPTIIDFIARHGAPIVFTPGSGNTDVRPYLDAARSCSEANGIAVVFLSPYVDRKASVGDRVLIVDFAEMRPLLRRAKLLVHQGGIGTIARALESGTPQLLRPLYFDQPDNADRVQRLGVGRALTVDAWSGETVTQRVTALLGDPDVASTLELLQGLCREDQAVESCAEEIEAFVH